MALSFFSQKHKKKYPSVPTNKKKIKTEKKRKWKVTVSSGTIGTPVSKSVQFPKKDASSPLGMKYQAPGRAF